MPCQGVFECRQPLDALLAQGRKVTADATKHRHSFCGAETPGDLLLHFNHAQIALGLVIGLSRQLHRLHL